MKQTLLKTFLLFLITIYFTGCENEDVNQTTLNHIEQIKKSFSLSDYNDDFVKNNLVIDWNNFNLTQENDSIPLTYEFNTSFKVENSLDNGKQKLEVKYKLLVSKNDLEQWDFELIKFLSSDSNPINDIGYFSIASFSGTIYHYNLNGENTKIEAYKKGLLVDQFISKDLKKTNPLARYPETITTCNTCWIFVRTEHYTDWYGSSGPNGSFVYTHSVLNYVSYEYVYVGGSYTPTVNHSHYDAPHGAGTYNHPEEVIIDPSFLNTKADCVYNKLAQLNGNLFKKTIGNFINNPDYNLIFKVGNCTTTNDACTDASNIDISGDIIITIEDINQSGLGIAALILHEAIHAEIYRYVSRYQSGVDPNNRPRLFQLYAFYKGWAVSTQDENYNWTNDAQHQYMVENYVTPIANAIRELDNFKYPLSYYMAYGWDGLTKYGYASKRLTSAENTVNQDLRAIANQNSQICN